MQAVAPSVRKIRAGSYPIGAGMFLIIAGCAPPADLAAPSGMGETGQHVPSVAAREPAFEFDFGAVVAEPGVHSAHEYAFTNRSPEPIDVLEFVNDKPCCGEVEPIRPMTLAPGESIPLRVTVRTGSVRGGITQLQHRALLRTAAGGDPIEFLTYAKVYPPAEIVGDLPATIGVEAGGTTSVDLEAVAYAAPGRSPDLDRLTPRSASAPIAWLDSIEIGSTPDGLVRQSRRFRVDLAAPQGSKAYADSVELVSESFGVLASRTLRWRGRPPFALDPSAIIVPSGEGSHSATVTVSSNKGVPFRIKGVDIEGLVGVEVANLAAGSSNTGTVRFSINRDRFIPGPIRSARIMTDDPNMPEVQVPILMARPANANRK